MPNYRPIETDFFWIFEKKYPGKFLDFHLDDLKVINKTKIENFSPK